MREDVHAACEMLGLDPLHVACEGRLAAFMAERTSPVVLLKSRIGGNRILDMPSGEQLPRIC